jgi:hypothetical protein
MRVFPTVLRVSRTVRPVRSVLVALGVGAALLAPVTSAHAAETPPWSSYLWQAGAVCTYDVTYTTAPDVFVSGPTEFTVRVHERTSSAVTVGDIAAGDGSRWQMTAGGGLLATSRFRYGAGAPKVVMVDRQEYPTVEQVRARQGATRGTSIVRTTYGRKAARKLLTSGRTLVATGTFVVTGLGERTITLPSGPVTAIGVKTTLRSVAIKHAKRSRRAALKRDYRDLFRESAGQEWWSEGRGYVLRISGTARSISTGTQRSCT